jgi:hypothetical protein
MKVEVFAAIGTRGLRDNRLARKLCSKSVDPLVVRITDESTNCTH